MHWHAGNGIPENGWAFMDTPWEVSDLGDYDYDFLFGHDWAGYDYQYDRSKRLQQADRDYQTMSAEAYDQEEAEAEAWRDRQLDELTVSHAGGPRGIKARLIARSTKQDRYAAA